MNEVIKNILLSAETIEDKISLLEDIKKDIDFASKIIDGEYRYCPDCDEYYLARSFFTESETKECKICTYSDPINSGGNEYADGFADIVYEVCPKGHKIVKSYIERIK